VTDLRTLAQAVVSAYETYDGERAASVGRDYTVIADCRRRYYAVCKALGGALDDPDAGLSVHGARAILAALDAERAQGYARAMGEVVERCEAGMSHHGGYLSPRSRGLYHAFEDVADWARERLPAAAERD
jgi:hypothetical protein